MRDDKRFRHSVTLMQEGPDPVGFWPSPAKCARCRNRVSSGEWHIAPDEFYCSRTCWSVALSAGETE